MQGRHIMKYNPAFLSPDELVSSFVVRHTDLDLIVEILRENSTNSNQHVLVIGPRGSGKTMLALRVVAEVKKEKELRGRWYPLVFAEESYQVITPGEFWLEAIFHLGEQTGNDRWRRTHRELSQEQDEVRLRERALAQLMDFADAEGKRILLVVENFNMLLGNQMSSDDAWTLRHTLLNEPRLMLLATATNRFAEVESSGQAMFELFKIHQLRPLTEDDCRRVWASITGEKASDQRVRPLHILTGGNPRLLAIISSFGARLSLRELMEDLVGLVDEHTEYFKTHLDNLPATERKVYLAMVELWDPATAREVATGARIGVSKTSSLLNRLVERGAVVIAQKRGRKKYYQVSERMYNIYYLMRRRGAPAARVKAVVNFMVNFYGEEELIQLARVIAEEACVLDSDLRTDHYLAIEAILVSGATSSLRDQLLEAVPERFFEAPDIPASIRRWVKESPSDRGEVGEAPVRRLLERGDALMEKGDDLEEAERAYRKAVDIAPQNGLAWGKLGLLLHQGLSRYEEAEQAYQEAIKFRPEMAWAWGRLGELLHEHLGRYEDAERSYRRAIELDPEIPWGWAYLGNLLHEHLKRYEEAEGAYREALRLQPEVAWGWTMLGRLLEERLGRYDEAQTAYRKAVELEPQNAWGWMCLGSLLYEHLESYEEALEALRKVTELAPDNPFSWAMLGIVLYRLERNEEAEKSLRKCVELNPEESHPWLLLGEVLDEGLHRWDEAEEAYRKATELEPESVPAWALLSRVLHRHLERYENAEGAYRRVVELDPERAWGWHHLGELLHDNLGRYEEAEAVYRKAVELDPKNTRAWAKFGELLHTRLSRYEEAEQAYRNLIELEPNNPGGWFVLGVLLHYKLERYEEAEQAYRKAVSLEPESVFAWGHLGVLLHEQFQRHKDAEEAYRHAIRVDPQGVLGWRGLVLLSLDDPKRSGEALTLAEECLKQNPKNPEFLNNFAWAFFKHGPEGFLGHSEAWARKAVSMAPDDANYRHTFAFILAATGKGTEALQHAQRYLEDPEGVKKTMDDGIDLFVCLAARGYAREALEILRASPSASALEPLAVGLALFVGEDVNVASEILEIARDVVKRIEERRSST